MVAAFMSAIALSGAFGGPVSGWIMTHMKGAGGAGGLAVALLAGGHSLGPGGQRRAVLPR
jgi:hypothetical protein